VSVPRFSGQTHIFEDLGNDSRQWTPTEDYLLWLEFRYPKLGAKVFNAKWRLKPRRLKGKEDATAS